jgi:hypothetical protein
MDFRVSGIALRGQDALGALCFGCGYLTAFIVTRTKFRNENDQTRCRPLRLGDRQMGLGKAAETEILIARSPLSAVASAVCR